MSLDVGSITRENCNTPEVQLDDTNDEVHKKLSLDQADDENIIVVLKTAVPPLKPIP